MARFFLSVFFICLSLMGSSLEPIFVKFDKEFTNASKQIKVKLHNEVKDLYVKSLIKNDDGLRKESLTRLVKSSKVLGFTNLNKYQSELDELTKITKTTPKLLNKSTDVDTNKRLYILSATKSDSALVLKFNRSIGADELKIYSLNDSKNFRNIVDIRADINGKGLRYKDFLVKEIIVAQNTPSLARIVFRDSSQQNLDAKIDGQLLFLSTKKFVSNENINKGITSQKPQNQNTTKDNTKKPTATPTTFIGNKTIVIDPGHGGNDPGAVNGKLQEKKAVLDVSKKLGNELKKRGYKVFYTREKDVFINLRGRTKIANDKNADLFISVHANAAPNANKASSMRGIETFFLSPARSERSKNAAALENKSDIDEMNFFSKQTFLNFLNREKIIASNKLGIDMQTQILNSIRARKFNAVDGGVREAPFWVLVGALMPAVLIEIGYITHPEEGKLLFNDSYQNALAQGIANGVDEYFVKNR